MHHPTASLSLSLAGFAGVRAPVPARDLIARAAEIGYRGIALDVSAPGVRPRDLDRSARRDLAAHLRKHELVYVGADLWIPPSHFSDTANADRALAAVISAFVLSREIASLVPGSSPIVSIVLPEDPAHGIRDALVAGARANGARLADTRPGAEVNIQSSDSDAIGVGVDPASLLLAGLDPASDLARLSALAVNARLSDADHAGRAHFGTGRLDIQAYNIALSLVDSSIPVIADMRGLPDPAAAARAVLDRWRRRFG